MEHGFFPAVRSRPGGGTPSGQQLRPGPPLNGLRAGTILAIDPHPGWAPPAQATQLVSDSDRERVAALLRDHWLAGRLSTEELEERIAAALAARDDHGLFATLAGLPVSTAAPAPAVGPQRDGSATASLVLGIIGLATLFVSFGFLSILTLPMSATAWGLGRSARRSSQGGESWRSSAQAGEVLGIIGTAMSSMLLAGCAAVIAL